jgi:hypothetical protein
VFVLAVSIAAVFLATGCSGELEPDEPDEAYLIYRKALLDGDVATMWERSSKSTHKYFERRYETLVEMDRKIREYLPQSDHKLARKQTGAELLDEIDGARGLFERIVRPDNMPVGQARELGSLVGEIRVSKDETQAKIVTRGGRTYRMVKQDDMKWYVALDDSLESLDKSFEWLERNDEALTQTVNDLRKEEREEREEIIADLMDVE